MPSDHVYEVENETDLAHKIPLVSGETVNVAEVQLPSGAWNVHAMMFFESEPAIIMDYAVASVSMQSNTIDQSIVYRADGLVLNIPIPRPTPPDYKFGPSTVYLTVLSEFTNGNCAAYGIIKARRALTMPWRE